MKDNDFLGLCAHCGCAVYRDGPIEFEGVYCNHKLPTREEVITIGSEEEE